MPTFRFLPLLAVFLTGGYAYHTATNVSESDIAAYRKLAQELGGFNAFPGDIVAVSSDGLSAQRICAVNTDSKHMDRVPIDATYVNSLSRILPRYQDVWALLRGAFTDGVRDATDRIAFQGQLRALSDDAPHAGLSESCECAMAERVARRERVSPCMPRWSTGAAKWSARSSSRPTRISSRRRRSPPAVRRGRRRPNLACSPATPPTFHGRCSCDTTSI